MSESDKPVQQSMRTNPNTCVMLNVFEYNPTTLSYTPVGRSALLSAAKVLQMNVTDHVTGSDSCKQFDYTTVPELLEFVPFHADLDLNSRIGVNVAQALPENDDSNDPYIVEKILKKRYNSHKVQYEYFVKWQGYSASENTWELPSNIPPFLLEEYEQTILHSQSTVTGEPRRSGLRDRSTRKVTEKHDYILNT